jgi:predicted RNA methylase
MMFQLNLFGSANNGRKRKSVEDGSAQLTLSLFDPVATIAHLTPEALQGENLIIEVGNGIAQSLRQGKQINASRLSQLMSAAAGGTDAEGCWHWKEAYEALEVGWVLYLRQYGKALTKQNASFVLKHLLELQALLPTQARRSEDQIELQQFSTPVSLAYLAAKSAQIQASDRVLEPSAGTGLLAIWAELAGAKLILNELHPQRRELLEGLFPGMPVAGHNAEQIDDYLDRSLQPSIVLMNPPFSASPNVSSRNPLATFKHVKSALLRLQSGGRLVSITGNWFTPKASDWREHFDRLAKVGSLRFSAGIEAKAYLKHGTNTETRLTIIDRIPDANPGLIIDECLSAADLLEQLRQLPPREVAEVSSPTLAATAQPIAQPRLTVVKSAKAKPAVANQTPASTQSIPAIPTGFGEAVELEYEVVDWDSTGRELGEGIYEAYEPQTIHIPGAQTHPTPLVQSAAMASVAPPKPTYRPLLPRRLIDEGILSEAQLEAIIYAGNAYEQFLAGWYNVDEKIGVTPAKTGEAGAMQFRRGFFIGDGTGVGKGREASGILLDNWLRGRRKALWISKSDKLLEDARRDWCSLGGGEHDIVPLSKFGQGDVIELAQGIVFTTYATLRTEAKQGKQSRVQQLVDWLGSDFDGVIVFDESHAMANALAEKGERGDKKASLQGIAGLRLQRALPQARVLYVSATGATKLPNLSYLDRLGLWGGGDTPFRSREDFISGVATGGVAALEVVARDLKALGLYTARSLSYAGVRYEILEHQLTFAQVEVYDRYAEAYQIIHQHIEEALEATNIVSDSGTTRNRNAKSAAYSTFESAKQRFFGHLLISMKCPTLIKAIEQDLEAGHAVVIQLVSTDEALLDRRLAEIPVSQHNDIQVDLTPREYMFDYLMSAFPVQLHEVWTDEEGNEYSRPVIDAKGNPVFSQEALRQRDALIESLALLPAIASGLDQITQHFGHELVAECTGRSRRIIRKLRDGSDKLVVQNRSANANLAETQMFQDDQKRILIFSQAGGTGRSYHADLNARNQRLRRHYLLEAGWRADEAIQGLGRTNRSNQAQPPVFVVISTDVKGEKRFTSTIARRLDSLGALTKGQRKTGGQGLFREQDNLESEYAKAALRQLFHSIYLGQIQGFSLERFTASTGLKLTNPDGGMKEELPPITQFLNRCLAMPIADQLRIFEELELRINSRIEQAIEAGVYEVGVETLRAEGFQVLERSVIYQHPSTGAISHAVKIERKQKTQITSVESAIETARFYSGQLCINEKSGRAAVVRSSTSLVDDDGKLIPRFLLMRPASSDKMTETDFLKSTWKTAQHDVFVEVWNREIQDIPEFTYTTFYLITGLLLPIWEKLDPTQMKVYRLQTDDGEQFLGRVVEAAAMTRIATQFGIKCQMSAQEIWQAVYSGKQSVTLLGNRLTLRSSLVAGQYRLEIVGFQGQRELNWLKSLGAFSEMHQWKMRAFIPTKAETAIPIIDQIRAAG